MIFTSTSADIESLPELLVTLDRIDRPMSSWALWNLARRVRIAPGGLSHFRAFYLDRVRIHEIFRSTSVEANVLCWRAGNRSPIHNHRGSSCCVKVIDGVLTNIDYVRDEEEMLQPSKRVVLLPGEVLQRDDRQIHRCENCEPDKDSLTLHLYSPPLAPMNERAYRPSR